MDGCFDVHVASENMEDEKLLSKLKVKGKLWAPVGLFVPSFISLEKALVVSMNLVLANLELCRIIVIE
jgi:hypothetical protein